VCLPASAERPSLLTRCATRRRGSLHCAAPRPARAHGRLGRFQNSRGVRHLKTLGPSLWLACAVHERAPFHAFDSSRSASEAQEPNFPFRRHSTKIVVALEGAFAPRTPAIHSVSPPRCDHPNACSSALSPHRKPCSDSNSAHSRRAARSGRVLPATESLSR
jgi:hypothetical protein